MSALNQIIASYGIATGTPTFDTAGLIADIEPDTFGLSNGASIVQLTNSVGGQNSGLQATSGNRATFAANELNGKGAALFDGAANFYDFDDILDGYAEGEIFIVVKRYNDPPAYDVSSGLWSTAADASTHFPYVDGNWYEGWGTDTRRSTGDPSLDLSTDYRLVNISSKSGEWKALINGATHYSDASNTVAFPAVFTVGYTSQGAGYYFDGKIARILIFSTVRTAPQRAAIEAYIQSYYGLTF